MNPVIAFANELAKYFVSSANKSEAASHIVFELRTYKDAHFKSLSDEEKILVLNLIEEFVSGKSRFILKKGEMVARRKEDYDEFLRTKKFILKKIHLA